MGGGYLSLDDNGTVDDGVCLSLDNGEKIIKDDCKIKRHNMLKNKADFNQTAQSNAHFQCKHLSQAVNRYYTNKA